MNQLLGLVVSLRFSPTSRHALKPAQRVDGVAMARTVVILKKCGDPGRSTRIPTLLESINNQRNNPKTKALLAKDATQRCR